MVRSRVGAGSRFSARIYRFSDFSRYAAVVRGNFSNIVAVALSPRPKNHAASRPQQYSGARRERHAHFSWDARARLISIFCDMNAPIE